VPANLDRYSCSHSGQASGKGSDFPELLQFGAKL
jgi:hypothetical protein